MEGSTLLVSEEDIRDPDFVPLAFIQFHFVAILNWQRVKDEARIPPGLPKVDIEGIILHSREVNRIGNEA